MPPLLEEVERMLRGARASTRALTSSRQRRIATAIALSQLLFISAIVVAGMVWPKDDRANAARNLVSTQTVLANNGDGTKGTWSASGSSGTCNNTTTLYGCTLTADGNTSYIQQANLSSGSYFATLADTSSDFVQIKSISVKSQMGKQSAGASGGTDTQDVCLAIYKSDETTAMTNEVCHTGLANAQTSFTDTLTVSLPQSTKTDWDGARMRIRNVYTAVGAADTTSRPRVSYAETTIQYIPNTFPKVNQRGYIWENDDEDQAAGDAVDSNTVQAAGNTSISSVRQGERLTLRAQINNTGTGALTGRKLGLFYDNNDGIWAPVQNTSNYLAGGGSCTDATFACQVFGYSGATTNNGVASAVDSQGNPWVAFIDASATKQVIRVAHYVGQGGGTNCGGTNASNWNCSTVDATNPGTNGWGDFISIAIDGDDQPWIFTHDRQTTTNAIIATTNTRYSLGTTSSTNWRWDSIAYNAATVGSYGSIAIDAANVPWVAYYSSSGNKDLYYARYVGTGGGCTSNTRFDCGLIDTSPTAADDNGLYVNMTLGADQRMWVSYYNAAGATNTGLWVANFVTSGGTGCTGTGTTVWSCTKVDGSTTGGGSTTSINFDGNGAAWVSYYDSTNTDLRYAKYVGSGGGCTSSAWNCNTVHAGSDNLGSYSSIAFAPDGNPWIAYNDSTGGGNQGIWWARYVGSGGNCGASNAWTCTQLQSGSVGTWPSMRFNNDGRALMTWLDASGNVGMATLNRGGAIRIADGVAGDSGDSLAQSHSDMSSASDSSNKSDADCLSASTTWNNGAWFERPWGAVTVPAGNSTAQCTEIAWVVDTSGARAGGTFRFVIATLDQARDDVGMWRGPGTVTNYPTLSVSTPTNSDVLYAKNNEQQISTCNNNTNYDCFAVDSTGTVGQYNTTAVDRSGRPWVFYEDGSNNYLKYTTYVGTGGSGCTSATSAINTLWSCGTVDTDYSGNTTQLGSAIGPDDTKWVSFYHSNAGLGNGLAVAKYVGSGGSCSNTAWDCMLIDAGTGNNTGVYSDIAIDAQGNPWISYYDAPNTALKLAHYVGSGGNCTDQRWYCETVDGTSGASYGQHNSIAIDNNNVIWLAYRDTTTPAIRVANYVGAQQGSGCSATSTNNSFKCVSLYTSARSNPEMLINKSGTPEVLMQYSGKIFRATFVGSGGSCTSTAWSCAQIDTNASGNTSVSGAFDNQGKLWVTEQRSTQNSYIIHETADGSANGTCATTTYLCDWAESLSSNTGTQSLAIGPDNIVWMAENDNSSGDLRIIKTNNASPGQPAPATGGGVANNKTTNAPPGLSRYPLDHGWAPRGSGACTGTTDRYGYCGVLTSDNAYDSMTAAANERPEYYAMLRKSNNTSAPYVTFEGQSSVAPSSSNIKVQVYAFGSTSDWVDMNTISNGCASGNANTDCTITAIGGSGITTTSDFWQSYTGTGTGYVSYFRVIQAAASGSATTLKVDQFTPTASANSAPSVTAMYQYHSNGSTQVAVGGYVSTNIVFSATVTDADGPNDVTQICPWRAVVGSGSWTGFTCTTFTAASTTGVTIPVTINAGTNGSSYRWRLDVKDGAGNVLSGWYFTTNGSAGSASDPTSARYIVDTGAPSTGSAVVNDGIGSDISTQSSLTQLSANWSGFSDAAAGIASDPAYYEYSIGTSAGGTQVCGWTSSSTQGTPACTMLSTIRATSVTTTGLTLTPGSTYYVNVRVYDAALNVSATVSSNGVTISTNTAPDSPTTLRQYKSDGSTSISAGGWTNESTVVMKGYLTDPDGDNVALCAEAKTVASSFTNSQDGCGSNTTSASTGSYSRSGLSDGLYHWQARAKDPSTEYSSWVSCGASCGNTGDTPTAGTDFGVDTTAPSTGTIYDGTSIGVDATFNDGSVTSLSANWSGFSDATSGLASYDYSIGTSVGGTDIKSWTSNSTSTSVTATGLSLRTGQIYYVNIRAIDTAGNTSGVASSNGQLVAPSLSFSVTPSSTTFAKLNSGNSYTDTQTISLSSSTNAYGGYVIRAVANTALTQVNGSKTVPMFNGGTYASPDTWQSGDIGFGYTSSDTSVGGVNKFQAATCPGGTTLAAPGCYAPFTTTTPGDIIADESNGSGGTTLSGSFTLTLRVTTSAVQQAGVYRGTIVFINTPTY